MSKNKDMLSLIIGSTFQLAAGVLFAICGMLIGYKGIRFIICAVRKYVVCWHCR